MLIIYKGEFMNELIMLINELKSEVQEYKNKQDDQSDLLFSDGADYQGDWGEGNEWLGYCAGRKEGLQSVINKLEELDRKWDSILISE